MFNKLNSDTAKLIQSHLDPRSFLRLSQAFKFFNSLDNREYWFKKISEDFNIPIDYLFEQNNMFLENGIKPVDIYKNLHILKNWTLD